MEFSSEAIGSHRNEGNAHIDGAKSIELLHAASVTGTFYLVALKAGLRVFQSSISPLLVNHL